MFDPAKIREDFPIFKNNANIGKPFIYLDNAATTFKPYCVINAIEKYNQFESANSHRSDYDIAYRVDKMVKETRQNIASFINANPKNIIFTSGCTQSLNTIAFGYALKNLSEGDEIIISEAEHASNVLPWFRVAELNKCVIKYAPLDEQGKITPEALRRTISDKTKIVSFAQVSNVIGQLNDIKELAKIAHEHNAIFVCDAAQSAPHIAIDVKDLDVDFLALSGHKMLGPTGIGVLYGKDEVLSNMEPHQFGGGDNADFSSDGNYILLDYPAKFEAGTLNLSAIYGLNECINYLRNLGMENIAKHESELKKYAIEKLKTLQNIEIFNENTDSGIITFNYTGVFPQDEASYLNSKGISVRSGEHCAKLLKKRISKTGSVRVSFYIYNTHEDVDALCEALKNGGDYLDAYFD